MNCAVRFGVAVAAIMCASSAWSAQPATADLLAKLDATVPRLMTEYDVPGSAIAVIENRKVVAIRTYGVADERTGRKVTAETLFNVGSVSKTFSSWAAMRLVSEGKIDLDAPVDRYLTRWHLPSGSFDSNGVTMRRLLSHTAGLNVHGYQGYLSLAERPSIEASLAGTAEGAGGGVKVVEQPGQRWSYSGGGYTVAQLAIEEVVKQPFATYLDQRVLPAMGLSHSHFGITQQLIDRSSRPHDETGHIIPMRVFTEMAAAGLSTTIQDLAGLGVLTLHEGVTAHGNRFLPQTTFREMIRPEVAHLPIDRFPDDALNIGVEAPGSGKNEAFGLGYQIYRLPDGRTVLGHGGSNIGWRAAFYVVQDTGEGIAIVTNADGGLDLRDAVLCNWGRYLAGTIKHDDCSAPAAAQLRIAYRHGNVDEVLAKFHELQRDARTRNLSDATLVEVAYSILSLGTNAAKQRDPVKDALSLLQTNLKNFPDSPVTLVGLANVYALATDNVQARAYAERALKSDITDDERGEMQALIQAQ